VDGISITKTSRTSQIGGALLGGILFGGFGALVGGLTGKTSTSNKVNRIDLRLTVNNTEAPFHEVHFRSMQMARQWHALIEVLIKRADEDERRAQAPEPKRVESIADELAKLAELRRQEILTENEFNEQKAKLLSRS
jgi:hypothetical protein